MANVIAIKNNGESFIFPKANLSNVRRQVGDEIKEYALEGDKRWNEIHGINVVETTTNSDNESNENSDAKKPGRKPKQ